MGFGFPTIGGMNGVMVVAESLGEHEANKGEFLIGPAGWQFNHVLKRGGFKREDFTAIENVIHCFPGDSLVEARGIRQGYRRWYSGNIVTVTLRSGGNLTGTPNHPVMTSNGWIILGKLVEGDNLIRGAFHKRVGDVNPNIENRPTKFEQLFRSLSYSGIREWMIGSRMDFHGDGKQSDVDIVSLNGLFDNTFESSASKPIVKSKREVGGERFVSVLSKGYRKSLSTYFFPSRNSSSNSRMSSIRKGLTFNRIRKFLPTCFHSFVSVSERNSISNKGFSQEVLPQVSASSNSLETLPLQIGIDQIVKIEWKTFSGHVYNLSTSSGQYITNGYIVSNCRPPNNKLSGQSYEQEAILKCSPFLDETIELTKPKAILAMGGVALKRLTGQSGILKNRGFIFESKYGIPVVGTFHPSYLLPRKKEKSSAKYTWVMIMDMRKALRIAQGRREILPQNYLLDPSIDKAKQFIGEYERTDAETFMAWDLETVFKLKHRNEQKLKLESRQTITRISFAFKPGHAMTIPWEPDYIQKVVESIFRINRPKVGWNCPTPDQRILTSDLIWKRAGDLKVGDKLVGFEETAKGHKSRRYKTSKVIYAGKGRAKVYGIIFNDGSMVKVSAEHPWLITDYTSLTGKHNTDWIKTKDLKIGQKFARKLPTWKSNFEYEDGYLSGIYDGEGSLTYTKEANSLIVSFSQNKGKTLKRVKKLLIDNRFKFSKSTPKREKDKGSEHIKIAGGKGQVAKFLGKIRPYRLLNKFKVSMLGSVYSNEPVLEIVDIHYLGVQDIIKLSTSTSTYLLEGFGAHNSKGFDEPIVILQEGMELNGTLYDGMDQFHVFQPNIERNLEFVTSILTDHLSPWKHTSQVEPEQYSAQDSDATISNVLRLRQMMREVQIPEYV